MGNFSIDTECMSQYATRIDEVYWGNELSSRPVNQQTQLLYPSSAPPPSQPPMIIHHHPPPPPFVPPPAPPAGAITRYDLGFAVLFLIMMGMMFYIMVLNSRVATLKATLDMYLYGHPRR